MNNLKKYLGFVWIIIACLAAYFCISTIGIPKVTSESQDDQVFGIIVTFILTPIISGGMFTFGLYSIQNEYKD
ncbi:MAG: DUF6814 family protein [Leadbetterella sp.]